MQVLGLRGGQLVINDEVAAVDGPLVCDPEIIDITGCPKTMAWPLGDIRLATDKTIASAATMETSTVTTVENTRRPRRPAPRAILGLPMDGLVPVSGSAVVRLISNSPD